MKDVLWVITDQTIVFYEVCWFKFMSTADPKERRHKLHIEIENKKNLVAYIVIGLILIIIIDWRQRPKKDVGVSKLRQLLSPLEFILMPLAGFLFNALPGIDAHTRLMLGKYIEYRVTEKV